MNMQDKTTPTITATSDCCLNNSAIQENKYISANSNNGAVKIRYFGFIFIDFKISFPCFFLFFFSASN